MPSNRELMAAAATLGEKLGVAVKTDGLGNADLVKLVAELEEQSAAAAAVEASSSPPAELPATSDAAAPEDELETPAEPPADETKPPADLPAAPPAAPAVDALRAKHKGRAVPAGAERPKGPYKVAAGRSIFCARSGGAGLQGGEKVRSTDFEDEELDRHWRNGSIVKA